MEKLQKKASERRERERTKDSKRKKHTHNETHKLEISFPSLYILCKTLNVHKFIYTHAHTCTCTALASQHTTHYIKFKYCTFTYKIQRMEDAPGREAKMRTEEERRNVSKSDLKWRKNSENHKKKWSKFILSIVFVLLFLRFSLLNIVHPLFFLFSHQPNWLLAFVFISVLLRISCDFSSFCSSCDEKFAFSWFLGWTFVLQLYFGRWCWLVLCTNTHTHTLNSAIAMANAQETNIFSFLPKKKRNHTYTYNMYASDLELYSSVICKSK